ncbi:hypothetical protein E6R18_01530 [Streptomyces sp. A1277]|uniref:hypothetical protein n=1 Tax=Streptomyces sp. A1277 TaxID=2563103 RepID=UPI0010A28F86|nr:hypothetical protein [Streptomyces sp. A1277]THA36066.1 hypothetical protein E6R18_01530 [Streptomyces sp. A1277]
MDLYDVIDRAELNSEVRLRFGTSAPGLRPRLDPYLASAWALLETAMTTYDPTNAPRLVRAAAEAHRKYTAPGVWRTAGFLPYIFQELADDGKAGGETAGVDLVQHPRVEWAARVVDCVRAGLGNTEFSRLIEGIDGILAEGSIGAEEVGVG